MVSECSSKSYSYLFNWLMGLNISVPAFYKSNLPPCAFEEESVAFGCCAAVEFPHENAFRRFWLR